MLGACNYATKNQCSMSIIGKYIKLVRNPCSRVYAREFVNYSGGIGYFYIKFYLLILSEYVNFLKSYN